MKILLDAGADPELTNTKEESPLQLVRKKQNQYPQLVKLLEEAIRKKHIVEK